MAANIQLLSPSRIQRNPENPRIIFRRDELETLEQSIAHDGILVPLTIYQSGRDRYTILDGERRWRCALKLGLTRVPTIIQPEPDRMTNIMMMFAIHKTRQDWDPLPTAMKLQDLEDEFTTRNRRPPTEIELANLASIKRGEVRRLKKLLELPQTYRNELMAELEKPRSEQRLTVDLVLEATRGAAALSKRDVITEAEEEPLRRAIIDKFRTGVVNSTVAPRQLARIGRAVERKEVSVAAARKAAVRLIEDPNYSIEQAFHSSGEQVDFEHGIEQLAERLQNQLELHESRHYKVGTGLRKSLRTLSKAIDSFLAS
jgi:ParB family chromosome partitioning protein